MNSIFVIMVQALSVAFLFFKEYRSDISHVKQKMGHFCHLEFLSFLTLFRDNSECVLLTGVARTAKRINSKYRRK